MKITRPWLAAVHRLRLPAQRRLPAMPGTGHNKFGGWVNGSLVAVVAEGEDDGDESGGGEGGGVATLPGNPAPNERTPVDTELPPPPNAAEFVMPVAVLEGWATADGRYIEPESLGRRALPHTLMAMRRNPDGGWGGHDAAIVNGRIDTAERYDAAATINPETGQPYGAGVLAWRMGGWIIQDTPETESTLGYVRDGVLRGLSVDISEARAEIEVTEEDEDGWPLDFRERITQGALMGGTICPFPAFPGAYIVLTGRTTDAEGNLVGEASEDDAAVVASGALPRTTTSKDWRELGMRPLRVVEGLGCRTCDEGQPGAVVASSGPTAPPSSWFADPQLPGPTKVTITPEGRIFGHYAINGTCHTGYPGQCLTPEQLESKTGNSLFHLGSVLTAEGETIACGQVTIGTGHASTAPGSTMSTALAHYDNTGTAAADVVTGKDAHGYWFAGAVRPDATEDMVRALRGAKLSGDWRQPRPGNPDVELVALLAVNVPGFPVVETQAVAASGALVAVVAAGVNSVERAATPDYERTVAAHIERALRPMHRMRAQAALQRIKGASR